MLSRAGCCIILVGFVSVWLLSGTILTRFNPVVDMIVIRLSESKGLSILDYARYSSPNIFEAIDSDENVLEETERRGGGVVIEDTDNDDNVDLPSTESNFSTPDLRETKNHSDPDFGSSTVSNGTEKVGTPTEPPLSNMTQSAKPHKLHFVTFATQSYMKYANALVRTARAKASCKFQVTIYGMQDIDADFLARNRQAFSVHRGAGLWLWKPYVIRKKLQELQDGELLVYCDSMYLFEYDICSMMRADSDYMCFDRKAGAPQKFREWPYTKMDAYLLMDVKPDRDHIQPWAGFVFFRKTQQTLEFVDEWVKYGEDYRIMSFDPSVLAPDSPEMIENRNDQTVFSLLLRKKNMPCSKLPRHWLYNIRNDDTR